MVKEAFSANRLLLVSRLSTFIYIIWENKKYLYKISGNNLFCSDALFAFNYCLFGEYIV